MSSKDKLLEAQNLINEAKQKIDTALLCLDQIKTHLETEEQYLEKLLEERIKY